MGVTSYKQRDEILRSIGYPTYTAYLESELWASIKLRVLEKYGRLCEACDKEAHCVHHLGYTEEILSGRTIDKLIPLCRSCHYKVEFDGDQKRSLTASKSATYRVIRSFKPCWKYKGPSRKPEVAKITRKWVKKKGTWNREGIKKCLKRAQKKQEKQENTVCSPNLQHHVYCKCGKPRRKQSLLCRACINKMTALPGDC